MAQKEQVRAFKNELRNYNYYLHRIATLNNSIEWCYDMLGADPRAVDPSREPMHSPPNKDFEYKMRDDIERYRAKLKRVENKIDDISQILSNIENETRMAIKSVYIEGKQMRIVASKLCLSLGALQNRIDKAIERALE